MFRLASFSVLTVALTTIVCSTFGPPSSMAMAQEVTITIRGDGSDPDRDNANKKFFKGKRPAVDVAILLDTSNSMDGLINQAKSQLWKIVQQFAKAEKKGKTPELRVAVFEYGNTNLPAREGYIRQVVSLTDDLDKVSEALFSLSTSGGDEYCGQVIAEAVKRLDWSDKEGAYKAIFIAGNEPFTQGSVDFRKACGKAIQSGVIVNTIHCGDYQTGVDGKWKKGAEIAEGEFMNIDQDRKVVHIDAPQDKIIIELNAELNKTYLWYGAKEKRESFRENQIQQDTNAQRASGLGGFSSGRIATKAGKAYGNVGRDLVDSIEEDADVLNKVDESALPEKLQKMSQVEREEYVKEMAARRSEIKNQISEAVKARAKYVAEKQQELAGSDDESTFGDAISTAIKGQLEKSGFELTEE